jgi:hypothetical protein
MDVLLMNTVLWESVPDLTSVDVFHGADFGDWQRQKKPQTLLHKNLPWLWDSSQFFENHLVMYDLAVLRNLGQLAPRWFSSRDIVFEEYENMGMLANHFNMTLIRHNDLSFHFDLFTTKQNTARVNVDWIRAKTFELMGTVLSPRYVFRTQADAYRITGSTTISMLLPWKVFLCIKIDRSDWLPFGGQVSGIPLQDPHMRMVVEGTLQYFGYVRSETRSGKQDVLHYKLDYAFPGSRVLKVSPGISENDKKWTRLFTLRSGDNELWTVYMCNCLTPECRLSRQLEFTPEEREQRSLEIPLKNSTMESFYIGEGCTDHIDYSTPYCCYDRYSPHWETFEKIKDTLPEVKDPKELIDKIIQAHDEL